MPVPVITATIDCLLYIRPGTVTPAPQRRRREVAEWLGENRLSRPTNRGSHMLVPLTICLIWGKKFHLSKL